MARLRPAEWPKPVRREFHRQTQQAGGIRSTTSVWNTQESRLLSLPGGLRNDIWKRLMSSEPLIGFWRHWRLHRPRFGLLSSDATVTTSLRFVCHQASDESSGFVPPEAGVRLNLSDYSDYILPRPTLVVTLRVSQSGRRVPGWPSEADVDLRIFPVARNSVPGFIICINTLNSHWHDSISTLMQQYIVGLIEEHGLDHVADFWFFDTLARYMCERFEQRLERQETPRLLPIDVHVSRFTWRVD